jgi:hypothetical protein
MNRSEFEDRECIHSRKYRIAKDAGILQQLVRMLAKDALKLYEGKAKHFDALSGSPTEAYSELPDPSR